MKFITLVTAGGEQHGLINQVGNSVKDDGFKHMEPEWRAKAEKLKKEDSKVVKARYINKRGTHERLSKPYCRWAGEPIQMWHFIPNHTYDVPMGLVNEINSKKVIKRSGLLSVDGKDVNGGTPTSLDTFDECIHEFVPVSF